MGLWRTQPLNELNSEIQVLFFVSIETNEVEDIYAFHSFGLSRRIKGLWSSITRDDSKLRFSSEYVIFELDWDRKMTLSHSFAEGSTDEHALIFLFDQGDLTQELLAKHANLHSDPSAD